MIRLLLVSFLLSCNVIVFGQHEKITAPGTTIHDGMKNFWKFNNDLTNSVTNGNGPLQVQPNLVQNCPPSPPFFPGSFHNADVQRYSTGYQGWTDGGYFISNNDETVYNQCNNVGTPVVITNYNPIQTTTDLSLGDSSRTFSVRVKFISTNSNFVDIFSLGYNASPKAGFNLQAQATVGGSAKFIIGNNSGESATAAMNFGTSVSDRWHTFTITYNGTDAKVYYDGSLLSTLTGIGPINTSTSRLKIGTPDMIVDEFRTYDRALTDDEVSEVYTADAYTNTDVYTYTPTPVATSVVVPMSKTQKIYSYPNPTKGTIEINTSAPIEQISVLSISGCEVSVMKEIQSTKAIVDLSALPGGIYTAKITTTEGTSFSKVVLE